MGELHPLPNPYTDVLTLSISECYCTGEQGLQSGSLKGNEVIEVSPNPIQLMSLKEALMRTHGGKTKILGNDDSSVQNLFI
jgi:hypothetical protein